LLIGVEQFTELDIIRAVFSLAFVVISIFIGLKILLKYFSLRRTELITVGLTWIFLSSPWWPLPVTFILAFVFNSGLDPVIYRYLMSAFIPVALICWIYSINNIVYLGRKKNLFYLYLGISLAYIVVYHVFIFINPDLISIYNGGFQFQNSLFLYFFFIFTIITAIITGALFALQSFKSIDAKIRWKGRFILLAVLVFIAGALADTFSFGNVIIQTFARFILIIASIFYYLGFFLPDWVASLIIKDKSNTSENKNNP